MGCTSWGTAQALRPFLGKFDTHSISNNQPHPAPSSPAPSPDVKSSTKNRPFTKITPPKSIKILHPLCLLPRSAVWTGPPSRHTSRRRSARTNSGRPRGARQRPLRSPRRAGDPRLGRLGHGTMRDHSETICGRCHFFVQRSERKVTKMHKNV